MSKGYFYRSFSDIIETELADDVIVKALAAIQTLTIILIDKGIITGDELDDRYELCERELFKLLEVENEENQS